MSGNGPAQVEQPVTEEYRGNASFAIGLSFALSFLMLGGKWAAYSLTGSKAIFSDAVESVVHLAATGIAAFSVWYSSRPADPDHPYGHGKIAYFSAGFEGALILVAALAIVASAIDALIRGIELTQLGIGIAITLALGLINLALGTYLIRVGKKQESITLIANGHHVLTDTWTSLGVVAGVSAVWLTGIDWLDPVIAIAVGAQIAWTAFSLIRRSFDGLMDRSDEKVTELLVARLRAAMEAELIEDFHQLRHREVDGVLWVDVHVLFPGGLPLESAHERVTRVERQLVEALPQRRIRISSHLEPVENHRDHHPRGHDQEDPLAPPPG